MKKKIRKEKDEPPMTSRLSGNASVVGGDGFISALDLFLDRVSGRDSLVDGYTSVELLGTGMVGLTDNVLP